MKLSILIPSKNEKYLQKTIDSLRENALGEIEILAKEDYGIGQRALTNELARQATGDYLMKVDAHCLFSRGYDVKLLAKMDDKTIMSPYLLVLDEESWTPKHTPLMSEYVFDTNLVMQHTKSTSNALMVETMCLQGSCWVVARETYWKWNLGEERLGSWGMQGTELGIKAYLNGGRCVTNKDCFYAHLFREKDESFPYERDKKAIQDTRDKFVELYRNGNIKGLIEKYNYPCDWSKENLSTLLKDLH